MSRRGRAGASRQRLSVLTALTIGVLVSGALLLVASAPRALAAEPVRTSASADDSAGQAEDLATDDAFARLCADEWPERAAQFTARATASAGCRAGSSGAIARARASVAYRDRFEAIVAEMGRVPGPQIRAFCEQWQAAGC